MPGVVHARSRRVGSCSGDAPAPVLVVDDEEDVRSAICRVLDASGYACFPVARARDAYPLLDGRRFALALCDLRLPGESGLELLRRVAESHPEVAPVVVTGVDEPAVAEHAVELGALGYLVKPFTPNELLVELTSALGRWRREVEHRSEREKLQQAVSERTEALRRAVARLRRSVEERRGSLEEAVRALARAAEFREEGMSGHVERVGEYSALLARLLGLEEGRCELIRVASLLHDVGKLAVPDHVLLKPAPLSPEERAAVERHAEIGYRILSPSSSGLLELAGTIAHTHHERFDGSGYPRGLAGAGIPLEGRIAAVADVFDALTSRRVYRPALPVAEAVQTIRDERGLAFDPEIVDLLVGSLDEVVAAGRRVSAGRPPATGGRAAG